MHKCMMCTGGGGGGGGGECICSYMYKCGFLNFHYRAKTSLMFILSEAFVWLSVWFDLADFHGGCMVCSFQHGFLDNHICSEVAIS